MFNFSWKDWTGLFGLIALMYGGGRWIAKFYDTYTERGKSIKKILEEKEEEKKMIRYAIGISYSIILLSEKPHFVCNDEGLCILANDALCELFGATEQEMSGKGWTKFILEGYREKVWREWVENVKNGGRLMSGKYPIEHGRTQKIVMVEYKATILREEKTEAVYVSVGIAKEQTIKT